MKRFWNSSGLIFANARPKVSCDWISFGNFKNVFSHSFLFLPNNSTSLSHRRHRLPHKSPWFRIFRKMWALVFPVHGSGNPSKCRTISVTGCWSIAMNIHFSSWLFSHIPNVIVLWIFRLSASYCELGVYGWRKQMVSIQIPEETKVLIGQAALLIEIIPSAASSTINGII